ncbi:unnamed protein product [Enterobius vermicularis]|uniref:SH3 domain-containing protein n=1 Tax=Enterobius vermicularis TaxID=51028 RepID=A0A0N4VJS8_ENTVE|nr:unnamed protein product [Enterobius vermicularis]
MTAPTYERRYQPRTQRRYPSMPPPQNRNTDYQPYNKVMFDDDRFETLRVRNSDDLYDSIASRPSSRWCDDCPYCRKMERLEAERMRRSRLDSTTQWANDAREYPETYREDSILFHEPRYGTINKPKPLGNLENSTSARASKFFKADKRDQLDVKQGELLQVLKKKPGWWKCKNVYGNKGWVPAQNLFLVPKQ